MWLWMYKAASPETSYRWARKIQPFFGSLCLISLFYGLMAGIWQAPVDFQQGDAFRIMYVHVPAAILSLCVYCVMSLAAFLFLIWNIKLADVIAQVSVPIGALFTIICLVSGSLWGRPMWGTWWIWDARLTSELLLLFLYVGLIALRQAIPNVQYAARASAVFMLVGLIDIPIVHYSVRWWNTLHQGASLSLLHSNIAPAMLHPLLAMMLGFFFYYLWVLCMRIQSVLLLRERDTQWVRAVLR